MKGFLEQYGTAIFTLVLMAILIAFAGPVGNMIKTNVNTQIQNVNEIGSERVKNVGRAEEPKEAVDQVYCILYDDGELTISQTEITPDENRTVLNKGYFTRPKDVDTTEGKQHILTVRFVGGVKPKSCAYWFGDWVKDVNTSLISCIHLTEIKNMENLYSNECTNMIRMFYNCQSLTTLDLSNFDTSNVTDMSCMFENCISLTALDVSNFDTSKVRSMSYMFENCISLTVLDVSNFDTSKVRKMSHMFYNCRYLTSLNLSNFDTNNILYMDSMFGNCQTLILDCSSWNVSKVTNHESFNTNAPNVIPPTWTN